MRSGGKPIEAHLVELGYDAGLLTDDDRYAIAEAIVDAVVRFRGGIIRRQTGEFRRLDRRRADIVLVPTQRPKVSTGRFAMPQIGFTASNKLTHCPRPREEPKPIEGHIEDLGYAVRLLADDDRHAIAQATVDASVNHRGVIACTGGRFRRIDPARTLIFFVRRR